MEGAAKPSRDEIFCASLAAALALALGLFLAVVWYGKELSSGLSDACGPAEASQTLTWTLEASLLFGVLGLMAALGCRRSRRMLGAGLAVAALVAIAVPAYRTDWAMPDLRHRFEALSPPGWTPGCYGSARWTSHGATVGRSSERYFTASPSDPLADPHKRLAFYAPKLPDYRCHVDRDFVVCDRPGSWLFIGPYNAPDDEQGHLVLQIRECLNGRNPGTLADLSGSWCGADGAVQTKL